MEQSPVVYVVDDEPSVLDSLGMLLRSANLEPRTFSNPEAFLAQASEDMAGCLVLDVRMPEMTGLELQEALSERGIEIPIIFVSGHGSIPVAVRATQRGAVDFLEKPFTDDALIESVQSALAVDADRRQVTEDRAGVQQRIDSLSVREREVVDLVVDGMSSKEVAEKLGLSEKTIAHYRARIMLKLNVGSVADLVRTIVTAKLQA